MAFLFFPPGLIRLRHIPSCVSDQLEYTLGEHIAPVLGIFLRGLSCNPAQQLPQGNDFAAGQPSSQSQGAVTPSNQARFVKIS